MRLGLPGIGLGAMRFGGGGVVPGNTILPGTPTGTAEIGETLTRKKRPIQTDGW